MPQESIGIPNQRLWIFLNRNNKVKNMKENEGLVKCSICDDYLKKDEVFYCHRCKKGPLCKKHRLSGKKECNSCSIDDKLYEINTLSGQENSIYHFIRFIQFIFLIVSVFFITLKFGLLDEIDFLKNNIITENLVYIGIGSAIFYAVSYLVLFVQKSKIAELRSEIEKIRFRKF
jgi:hypothetical protein